MAGYFPDARDTFALFKNLKAGVNSIGMITGDRIRKTTLSPGKVYQRRGYLDRIDTFDYAFFQITPGEAVHMDPHQRLLLEAVYHTLENAGITMADVADSRTAVFVSDRNLQYYQHADVFDPTLVTGNASEFLAARINRVFRLKGAVSVIDTSCSSALVALHHGCNEVLLGNADQAIICGANLELFPYKESGYHLEVDSPDGYSIPFTAESNGMVYGETVIGILIKPLQAAVRDKDNILCVIEATAVNSNAHRSASLTAPDSAAQAEVIRWAWEKAGIDPRSIGFIEAHGSGTQLGDTLEAAGLTLAFRAYTEDTHFCPVSTIKSNIGHCRSAAGLAGLVKAILALQNRVILPSLTTGNPNPLLKLDRSAVYISTQCAPWDKTGKDGLRHAGVSSIGFSGTNCHVVLGEYAGRTLITDRSERPQLIPVSSWHEEGLKEIGARLAAHLRDNPDIRLEDIAYTMGKRRSAYRYRQAWVVRNVPELAKRLVMETEPSAALPARGDSMLVFVFNGAEHMDTDEIRAFIASGDVALQTNYAAYLETVEEEGDAQAVRLAFQAAWYRQLSSDGCKPTRILSMGAGKWAAQVVAEKVSFRDAWIAVKEQQSLQDGAPTGNGWGLEKIVSYADREFRDGYHLLCAVDRQASMAGNLSQHPLWKRTFELVGIDLPDATAQSLAIAARCYELGCWSPEAYFQDRGGHTISLPGSPFRQTRCWIREEPKVQTEGDKKGEGAVAPQADHLLSELTAYWLEVLPDAVIDPSTHFFEAGGDSLKATRVIHRLRKEWSLTLDFEDLFDYPVLQEFYTYVYGRLDLEKKLWLIWKEVLRMDSIPMDADFFELGGHSLLASRILNRIRDLFGVGLDFELFFRHPTISGLAGYMREHTPGTRDATTTIPVAPPASSYPLSPAQQRLWILSQVEEGSLAYHEFNAFYLDGDLRVDALKQSWRYLVERHEILRTGFEHGADGPHQVIMPFQPSFDIHYEDWSGTDMAEQALEAKIQALAKTPFRLERPPLLAMHLFRLRPGRFLMVFNIHHILFDEWSNQVLIQELGVLYTGICKGLNPALAPMRLQYKDYAVWMQSQMREERFRSQESYWLEKLKGHMIPVGLPYDFERPAGKVYRGRTVKIPLPQETLDWMRTIAREQHCSMFMVTTALVQTLLYRYSGHEDIIVGTPIAGRDLSELEGQIGFYANTLPLLLTFDDQDDFASVLSKTRQAVIEAYEHQYYPFDLMVDQLDAATDRSRHPIFDVMVGYRKATDAELSRATIGDLTVSPWGQGRVFSKFDLSWDFTEAGKEMLLTLTYNESLFLKESVQRMGGHLIRLVGSIAADFTAAVAGLAYMDAEEEQQVLYGFARGAVEPLPGPNVVGWLKKQASRYPGVCALETVDARFSYAELVQAFERLAGVWMEEGVVAPGQRIGIVADGSSHSLLSVCAVLAAGAVFIPISPVNPLEMNLGVLHETGASLLIGEDQEWMDKLASHLDYIDCIQPSQWANIVQRQPHIRPDYPGGEACILFTSGSSGAPKGVPIRHEGLLNIAAWAAASEVITPTDRLLQRFSLLFDVSLFELFGAWCNGATLVLASQRPAPGSPEFLKVLTGSEITHCSFTPTELRAFVRSMTAAPALPQLRAVLSAGEILPRDLADEFYAHMDAVLYNAYGPTENSIFVTCGMVDRRPYEITIGNPLPNTHVLVLDAQGQPCGIGVAGEIYLGGTGVSEGYLIPSDGSFVRFPEWGDSLYFRTGDWGKWRTGGALVFLGRQGGFVKLNGFRVSPDYIQQCLENHPDVRDAVVVIRQTAPEKSELFAFVVPARERMPKVAVSQSSIAASAPAGPAGPQDLAVMDDWNRTGEPFDEQKLIHHYLEDWAVRTPHAPAARCAGEQISYEALNRKANFLAAELIRLGLRKDEPVPVYMPRSIDLMAAMLGISKAGGAYLPLSEKWPQERIRNVLQLTGARFVLVCSGASETVSPFVDGVIDLASLWRGLRDLPNPSVDIGPDSLAYIIFTSGSTGLPKGAMIEHRGMMNHLFAKKDLLGLSQDSIVVQNASQSFDISIWQFLAPVLTGGTTLICPDTVILDPSLFWAFLYKEAPKVLEVVPSYLMVLLDAMATRSAWPLPLEYMVATGETLPAPLAARWFAAFPHIPLVNAYGPTEASDDITHHVLRRPEDLASPIPVGRPVRNMKIYVVDELGRRCPIGVKGEIWVSGKGVGRGYLGNLPATTLAFQTDPWQPGVRLYRTGDVGRFDPSGALEFFGRKDQQVKVNGFRIEIEEVESALSSIPAVRHAAVQCWQGESGSYLAGYVVVDGPIRPTDLQIKEALALLLPTYMVPEHVVFLDTMPLTANGKIDRKALADPGMENLRRTLARELRHFLGEKLPIYAVPEQIQIVGAIPLTPTGKVDRKALLARGDALQAREALEAPASALEALVASAWAKVLQREGVGVTDPFMHHGGNSLKAMRLSIELERATGHRFKLQELFTFQTIREQAGQIARIPQTAGEPIPPAGARDTYPLSYAQQRMWIMSVAGLAQGAYTISGGLHFRGSVDRIAFRGAWAHLFERHEMLRTVFEAGPDGMPVQRILEGVDPQGALELETFPGGAMADQLVTARARTLESVPFDLGRGPLMRGVLISREDEEHWFVYTVHHIIADEPSIHILGRDLVSAYGDFAKGQAPEQASPGALQYKDFACWQREGGAAALERSKAFWLEQMRSPLPVLELPTDRERPPLKTYGGASDGATIDPSTGAALDAFCVEAGATPFMCLYAAVLVLLYRYTGQEECIVGVPVSGRDRPGLETPVGLLLNTLPLRASVSAGTHFEALVADVRRRVIDAFGHQDYPFDKLVDELEPDRDLGRSPLFDVMMVLHDDEGVGDLFHMRELTIAPLRLPATGSKFDLTFHFGRNTSGDWTVGLNYNTGLFEARRISLMLAHFRMLLRNLLLDRKQPVALVDYLGVEERGNLLAGWQGIGKAVQRRIETLWAEQVAIRADKTAVVDEYGTLLSYGAADLLSDRWASLLIEDYAVGPESVVAILVTRQAHLVPLLIGVLKTGATLMPMEHGLPEDRMAFMLEDSGCKILVTDTPGVCAHPSVTVIPPDPGIRRTYRQPAGVGPGGGAYIVYTSGTTGRPKGILIRHYSLVTYVESFYAKHGLSPDDRCLFASSLLFDGGYKILWTSLLKGCTLYLLKDPGMQKPAALLSLVRAHRCTMTFMTPSQFQLVLEEQEAHAESMLDSLHQVCLGGEMIRPADVGRWFRLYPGGRIINHYGPAETTIGVLSQIVGEGGPMRVAEFIRKPVLGTPIGPSRVLVLDERGALCGVGVPGELYIGGPGLAKGYLNRPELTEERFVADPFLEGERMYRTGDRGRWNMEGYLEFMGRVDDQVQINGIRVEPGEVEQVLNGWSRISGGAVLAVTEGGAVRLEGYYVGAGVEEAEVRSYLGRHVPAYMVPSRLRRVERIPMNGSGKVDRKVLLSLVGPEPEGMEEGVLAESREETLLSGHLSALLGGRPVRMGDRFFELGGDSIKAIQLSSRLYREGYELEVRDIFQYPVIGEMSLQMRALVREASQETEEGEVMLGAIQAEFFERGLSHPEHYNQSVLLSSEERLDEVLLLRVVELLHRHHDGLRMRFYEREGVWHGYNEGLSYGVSVEERDLRGMADAPGALLRHAQELQRGFVLESGPLFKACVYRMEGSDRLFLVAHHLVVDGVSWRIILEDLSLLYGQGKRGEAFRLPLKTTSFRRWTREMRSYVSGPGFSEDRLYWQERSAELVEPMWRGGQGGERGACVFSLGEEETGWLLGSAHRAYRTEVNDLLLSAVGQGIGDVWGRERVWLMLEGHGREKLEESLDVRRTVGWFTSVYPVCVGCGLGEEPGRYIKEVKEVLRGVPNKGIGYGWLRYGGGHGVGEIRGEVLVNYLGQFDADISGSGFGLGQEETGDGQYSGERKFYGLEITAVVSGGILRVTVRYDGDRCVAEEARRFTGAMEGRLRGLVRHCVAQTDQQLTPGDFGYKHMSLQDFETLFD